MADVATLQSKAFFVSLLLLSLEVWEVKRSLASVILHQVSPGAKEEEGMEGERRLVTSLIRRQTRTRSLARSSGRRRLQHQRPLTAERREAATGNKRFKAGDESLIISVLRWRKKNTKERGSSEVPDAIITTVSSSYRNLGDFCLSLPVAAQPSRLGPV